MTGSLCLTWTVNATGSKSVYILVKNDNGYVSISSRGIHRDAYSIACARILWESV